MKPPAGVFADFKTVKTRSVCQLIIELPIEQADGALAALGGVPVFGKEKWVAVAPLTPAAKSTTAIKRDWPMASQIHMRCQEPSLWRFMQAHADFAPLWWAAVEHSGGHTPGGEIAADVVRQWCGVESRRFIVPGSEPAERWHTLEAEYEQWQRDAA